jgi:hypothetical protein
MIKLTFGEALKHLQSGELGEERAISRLGWYGTSASPIVKLQRPDKHSKMTEQYLYMEKRDGERTVRFPLDLSCESILAEDWAIML